MTTTIHRSLLPFDALDCAILMIAQTEPIR